jgi:hypothetical protein
VWLLQGEPARLGSSTRLWEMKARPVLGVGTQNKRLASLGEALTTKALSAKERWKMPRAGRGEVRVGKTALATVL